MPSLASSPTIICPGNSLHASRTKSGFFTAAVPIMTSAKPKSKYFSMVAKSRMPPPNCTGMSLATSARMDLMAGKFFGMPTNAPFKSTKCRRRAPCLSQCSAVSAGESENTVACSISPCFSRTQRPSFKSIAGISNILFPFAVRFQADRNSNRPSETGFDNAQNLFYTN